MFNEAEILEILKLISHYTLKNEGNKEINNILNRIITNYPKNEEIKDMADFLLKMF